LIVPRRPLHRSKRAVRPIALAPCRRPGACNIDSESSYSSDTKRKHPLCDYNENNRLYAYEERIKKSFDSIVPTLKKIASIQRESNFEAEAQKIAVQHLGFEMPKEILANAWVNKLDMPKLFAWCVFHTYFRFSNEFYSDAPLSHKFEQNFDEFIQSCGFHTVDISPCADGRLAHLIRYVLRLPHKGIRRKSYAGAMFDIDNSLEKWVETEMLRFREGKPNHANENTRYLKIAAYHFSSVDPSHQGCAAHGSDDKKAAASGLERLYAFRTAVENSFCCGASIDLLLIGLDTDTDSLKIHMPDLNGKISLDRFIDTNEIFLNTSLVSQEEGRKSIIDATKSAFPDAAEGMVNFIAHIIENNLSQIEYVKQNFGNSYPDIGHAERFIGAGVGFEEIQLRNLMYFAYLQTVEEAAADTDVGIKIFSGLNVKKGLPIPVVVRFDYHGQVPGAKDRAKQHCQRVSNAFQERYAKLNEQDMIQILQVVRDCSSDAPIEIINCSVTPVINGDH